MKTTVTLAHGSDAAGFSIGDTVALPVPGASPGYARVVAIASAVLTIESAVVWGDPRWRRLLVWALRLRSPSFGRVTLREAWTGRVWR